jgi:LysR family hca operon transcriptional activator
MELRHLRYFIAVAEDLSFTRAAARLRTAQPSLSRQIIQLEEEVGTPLLSRTKRRVVLTAAGRVFLREARLVLAKADQAVKLTVRAGTGEAGELSIGLMPVAEVIILPRLLPALTTHLPHVRVLLHSLSLREQLAALRDVSVDVAFLWGPVREADLVTEEVLRQALVVVLPTGHRLASRPRISLQALEGVPQIRAPRQVAPWLHDAVSSFFRPGAARQHTTPEADHVLGHLNLVRAGVGFALLPEYVESILPEGVVTRPLDWEPAPSLPVVLAHRRDDRLPALDTFKRVLKDALRSAPMNPATPRVSRARRAHR